MLEDLLKKAEIDSYKHSQLIYHSSLPLWVNSSELPEAPQPPEWLQEILEDQD